MVRVRHPGMQTPAGVCAATTGLDLVRVASGATHALIEYETRELAELAVRLKNDDKDWRHGLRVRLLVKNVKAAAKKKKQREERAQRDEGEEAEAEAEADTEKTDKEKTSETSAETGPETAPVSASKKKGKHKKGKRDYSQWASAAAFKENKRRSSPRGRMAASAPRATRRRRWRRGGRGIRRAFFSSAPPRAPTMPDGTRGFAFGAATGKPRRAFPPGVPTEPKKQKRQKRSVSRRKRRKRPVAGVERRGIVGFPRDARSIVVRRLFRDPRDFTLLKHHLRSYILLTRSPLPGATRTSPARRKR